MLVTDINSNKMWFPIQTFKYSVFTYRYMKYELVTYLDYTSYKLHVNIFIHHILLKIDENKIRI